MCSCLFFWHCPEHQHSFPGTGVLACPPWLGTVVCRGGLLGLLSPPFLSIAGLPALRAAPARSGLPAALCTTSRSSGLTPCGPLPPSVLLPLHLRAPPPLTPPPLSSRGGWCGVGAPCSCALMGTVARCPACTRAGACPPQLLRYPAHFQLLCVVLRVSCNSNGLQWVHPWRLRPPCWP